jgi:hypothetical protein
MSCIDINGVVLDGHTPCLAIPGPYLFPEYLRLSQDGLCTLPALSDTKYPIVARSRTYVENEVYRERCYVRGAI